MRILSNLVRALRREPERTPGRLEQLLGYRFSDRELLERALTHRSLGGRHASNERLELLGDAVLGLVVVECLLERFPSEDEGKLTKRRSYLVSKGYLATRAHELGLPQFVQVGRGEKATGIGTLPSVGANTLEAVLGAVYLDGGLPEARRVGRRIVIRDDEVDAWEESDPKSALQEHVQRAGDGPPTYVVVGERGPQHRRVFEVEVWLKGRRFARGTGRSKKAAQRAAAASALERVRGR